MKKIFVGLFALVSLGLGVGLGLSHNAPVKASAEGEIIKECVVLVEEVEHAKVLTSIQDGNVGDICVISIKSDFFWNVAHVFVNETELVESDTTFDEYSFALVAGENKIHIDMMFDEASAGVFATSIVAVQQKDWTSLFSLQNIMAILGWLLNGGILVTVIRYYVRDKKLAKSVEKATQESLKLIVPDATKQVVMENFEKVVSPVFTQLVADNSELKQAIGILAKCMALAQENTPEARKAIIDELSSIKGSNNEEIYKIVKDYIDNLTAEAKKVLDDTLSQIREIQNDSQKVIEEIDAIQEPSDDGTQI